MYVPDFDIYTEGKDLVDAIEMAEDAIGMTGMVMEDEGKKLPKASDYAMAYEKADKKVQDDSDRFDYTKGIITMVGNQMIDGATYCYNIVYGLTGDDKVKELMEGLAKINM